MAENLDERMADLSRVKRMELDIPYGSDSPAQRLDLFRPEAGGVPHTGVCARRTPPSAITGMTGGVPHTGVCARRRLCLWRQARRQP